MSWSFMTRRGNPSASIWDEFTVVEGTERRKYKDATCNHCGKTLTRVQPSRGMINHATKCPEMPAFLRNQYKETALAKAKKKKRPRSSSSEDSRAGPVPDETETPQVPETNSSRTFRFQMALAMMFYTTSVAFRVVELPGFRHMFSCICPTVVMPSRHDLAGELLNFAFMEERESVIAALKDIPFVALVSDGWSNPRRESLINFIIVAPGVRPLLWSCRVTGEDVKTGAYMAQTIGDVVDEIEREIGLCKVGSITTDNASSMQSAWAISERLRPGVLATGCAAHALSLLMKDVLAFATSTNLLKEAKEISLFIRSHTATNARFQSIQESDRDGCQRGLKLPVATRWYSAYECIKLVMENETIIRELFSDEELLNKYDDDTVARLTRLVVPEVFWAKDGVALQLLEPIHKCLAHFEKDSLCLSVIYKQFLELSRHPVYNTSVPGVANALQRHIKERVKYRWQFIHISARGMAYLLDHTKPTSFFAGDDKVKAIQDIVNLGSLLGYNQEKQMELEFEVTEFLSHKLNWSDDHRAIYYRSSPSKGWSWDGRDTYPPLAPIAERTFAIPTSSAASERSWSVFKFIHSARRNRLANDRVIKLAFIYSNHGLKEAVAPRVYDSVADLVCESSSGPSNADGSMSAEVLESIREMERLVGDPEDGTPVDEASFLSDGGVFDGSHWGDENEFPRQLDPTPVMVTV